MMEYIIYTNVPLVAQGDASQMSEDCTINCANFLEKLFQGHFKLVIDDNYHLIGEYEQKMIQGYHTQYGRRFLKWIYNYQANPIKVKTVEINQLDEYNFEEVPQSLIEIGFDNSDRKFIAVAIANENNAPIVQAADSEWIALQLQNRGNYINSQNHSQFAPIRNWAYSKLSLLQRYISNDFIVYGEWCHAKHSIHYTSLPDWFLGFDIYDIKNKIFLNTALRNHLLKMVDIEIIPLWGRVIIQGQILKCFY